MNKIQNTVNLIGRTGVAPVIRTFENGVKLAKFPLATNETIREAEGKTTKTQWHSIVAWGRLAEICGEYLKKGAQSYFEGSLQSRSYEDRDGNTRYVTEVKAREMMLLGGRGGDGGFGSAPQPTAKSSSAPQSVSSGKDDYTFEPDDELPF